VVGDEADELRVLDDGEMSNGTPEHHLEREREIILECDGRDLRRHEVSHATWQLAAAPSCRAVAMGLHLARHDDRAATDVPFRPRCAALAPSGARVLRRDVSSRSSSRVGLRALVSREAIVRGATNNDESQAHIGAVRVIVFVMRRCFGLADGAATLCSREVGTHLVKACAQTRRSGAHDSRICEGGFSNGSEEDREEGPCEEGRQEGPCEEGRQEGLSLLGFETRLGS
jgi:hypothetical protein